MKLDRVPIRISEAGQQRMLMEVGANYSDPKLAVKEYSTNSVDAIVRMRKETQERGGYLEVAVHKGAPDIVISDTAAGMSREKARSLPESIGDSDKIDEPDERGEKAVGMLAYVAMQGKNPSSATVITKQEGDKMFTLLHYGIENGQLVAGATDISRDVVNDQFYGAFDHGTRVVVRPDPVIFKDHFGEKALKRFLQETYAPLLVNDVMPMYFTDNSGKSVILEAPNFVGPRVMKENRRFQAKVKGSGGGKEVAEFPVGFLLHVNPEKKGQKIGLFAKDVRVYDSILQMEPSLAKHPFWGCGNVLGYVNSANLQLTLGREGIRRNTPAYKNLVSLLTEVGDEKWEQIQDILESGGREVANRRVLDAMGKLREAYQITKPLDVIPRHRGKPDKPIDDPEKPKPGPGPSPNPKPNVNPPRRRFGFSAVNEEFDFDEKDTRAKLDYHLGQPIVLINSGNDDYISYVINGTPKQSEGYLIDVISPIIAQAELMSAEEKGRVFVSDSDKIERFIKRTQDLKISAMNGKKR